MLALNHSRFGFRDTHKPHAFSEPGLVRELGQTHLPHHKEEIP
jgi:hypothetical protein